jgi:hypoxanthine-guanine phosphoribosyltransferase
MNVRGAFVVPDPQAVSGRHVLVIDDILTTGATARSVAQALLRAGAANVWIATLARARQAYGGVPRQVDWTSIQVSEGDGKIPAGGETGQASF